MFSAILLSCISGTQQPRLARFQTHAHVPLRHQRKGPHGSDKAVPPRRGWSRLVECTTMPVSTEAAGPGRVVGEEAPHELGAGHACTVREGVGVVGLEEQQALRRTTPASGRNSDDISLSSQHKDSCIGLVENHPVVTHSLWRWVRWQGRSGLLTVSPQQRARPDMVQALASWSSFADRSMPTNSTIEKLKHTKYM